jgi:hypothetical protein
MVAGRAKKNLCPAAKLFLKALSFLREIALTYEASFSYTPEPAEAANVFSSTH